MIDLAELARYGVAMHYAGKWDESERALREVLKHVPENAEVRRALAAMLYSRGDRQEGVDELRRAIECDPNMAGLQSDLGRMLGQMGRPEEAVTCYRKALDLDPTMWQARYNLGNLYLKHGRFNQAVESYQQALRSAPNDPGLLMNLGLAQKELGDFAAARANVERAMQLRPESADTWLNLGTICRAEGKLPEAIDCFQRALKLNPKTANAHMQLGNALAQNQEIAPALAAYQQALALDPQDVAAYRHVGNLQASLGQAEAARATFDEGARRTGDFELKVKRTLTLPMIVDSREQIEAWRGRMSAELDQLIGEAAQTADAQHAVGLPPFPLAYHGLSERAFQVQVAELARRVTPEIAFTSPHCAETARRKKGAPARVGFVSAHFFNHTIGKLNAGVIQQLDRKRFHVEVFHTSPHDDVFGEFVTKHADESFSLPQVLADAREQIAERKLDALIYTDIGMDVLTYFLAHSRLAPVQCTTWGHPVTTGIPTIDYFISSQDLDLPDAQANYAEKLARLAHLANYYFMPAAPSDKSREALGLPSQGRLYGCPQSIFKLHPDDDEVLGEILRRDPSGHLVMVHNKHAEWSTLWLERFRRTAGDACQRVQFLERLVPRDFSRLLQLVDALVDPLHFGGGDTSYQSFAVGAGVVTLPSEFLRGRITYALYRTMGVDDLIARDRQQYVELALKLANDRPWREQVSAKILAARETIFQNLAGVRDLEQFLAEAVDAARS